jgi:branched-chain amino acid transport system ATP-binding protein
MSTLLEAKNINASYDTLEVLEGVSVSIDESEVVALIGPNGAGKSTVIKTLFGVVELDDGKLWYKKEELDPVVSEMVERGISYVPQGRQIFASLTVRENLEIGGYAISKAKIREKRIQNALTLFPDLKEKINDRAGSLSGGQQQMLALARGLVPDPDVLLLDEPSLGLAPKLVKDVFVKIKDINQKHGTSFLIVEHNIPSLFSAVDSVWVLQGGTVAASGSPQEVKESGVFDTVFT